MGDTDLRLCHGNSRLEISLLLKIDIVFDCLKCAAQLSVAFGFVLKNVENGSVRYYYAHENNALLEPSKLVAPTEDLQKSRSYKVTPMSLNPLQENEPTQNGNFRSWRKLQILQHYSKKFPWAIETLYCQIHY